MLACHCFACMQYVQYAYSFASRSLFRVEASTGDVLRIRIARKGTCYIFTSCKRCDWSSTSAFVLWLERHSSNYWEVRASGGISGSCVFEAISVLILARVSVKLEWISRGNELQGVAISVISQVISRTLLVT